MPGGSFDEIPQRQRSRAQRGRAARDYPLWRCEVVAMHVLRRRHDKSSAFLRGCPRFGAAANEALACGQLSDLGDTMMLRCIYAAAGVVIGTSGVVYGEPQAIAPGLEINCI